MRAWYFLVIFVLTCVVGCASQESSSDEEMWIPISQVPEKVIVAARSAVEGITLTEAEVEEEDGQTVYELEGVASGVEYEIEVTADGKVLEISKEDEDDEDED